MAPLSKDLLERLRAVHFTLLLICLATAVIMFAPTVPLGDAASELSRLQEFQNAWTPKNFEEALAFEAGGGTCVDWQMPEGVALNIHSDVGPFRVQIVRKWDVRYDAPPDQRIVGQVGELETLKRPETLPEFALLWHTRAHVSCPRRDLNPRFGEFARGWSINDRTYAGTTTVPDAFVHSERQYPVKDFVWVDHRDEGPWQKAALFEISTSPFRWVLPADGRVEAVDTKIVPLADLLHIITKSSVPNGSFESAFPALLAFANDKRAAPLKDLQPAIDGQLGAERDSFSVFSIKFPLSASRRWAILLILLTQGYFSLHFAEFCKLGRPGDDIAWIGSYNGFVARTVTALTICVLPLATIIRCSNEALSDHASISRSAIALSVSISLATVWLDMSSRSRRDLAKQVDDEIR